jgi:hypothetical protein
MGFWERLIGPTPTEKDTRDLLDELLASYRAEARLARQIRAHAEKAPHRAGALGLRAAAEEQERLVRLLYDKIVALGRTPADDTGAVKEGKNHWTRVVHDLEDNQALERRYNEQAVYWDPEVPDAAALFSALRREKARLNALLRDIALRADPHALD